MRDLFFLFRQERRRTGVWSRQPVNPPVNIGYFNDEAVRKAVRKASATRQKLPFRATALVGTPAKTFNRSQRSEQRKNRFRWGLLYPFPQPLLSLALQGRLPPAGAPDANGVIHNSAAPVYATGHRVHREGPVESASLSSRSVGPGGCLAPWVSASNFSEQSLGPLVL